MRVRVDIHFWSDERQWPGDQPGFVFLLRAVKEVGRAMYPKDWTGGEYLAATSPLPNQATSAMSDGPRASRIIEERNTDRIKYTIRARDRFAAVLEQVGEWLQVGKLTSGLCSARDGAVVTPFSPRRWLNEAWERRFAFGHLIDGNYLVQPPWIFVTRESLDQCIRGLAEPEERQALGDKTRSFEENDEPLVAEMHGLITTKQVKSAKDAANQLVSRAKGWGSEDSRSDRLYRRYLRKYPQRKKSRTKATSQQV